MIFSRRGQNLVDLALLIGLVGLVVIGMEAYIRRGVQGKVKDLTDYIISDQQSAGDDVDRENTLSYDSEITSGESQGGARTLVGDEKTVSTYSQ